MNENTIAGLLTLAYTLFVFWQVGMVKAYIQKFKQLAKTVRGV
jgi:hypothetical protein